MEYEVIWRIQVDAETPDEAAREAFDCMRDQGSDATVMEVTNPETGETEEIDAALLDDSETPEMLGINGTTGSF
jgi:hypothetical protein